MDRYTQETQQWLDQRYRAVDAGGVYISHQPIYGFRQGHSEAGALARYLITFNILDALSHLAFGSLLDVGGAEGYKAALIRAVFGAAVRSDDLSAEACRRAQAIYGVDGAAVDIQRLPYPDNAFDVVLCSETLEHVADLEAATRELIRVCRRAVVITVPHEAPAVVARNIREKIVHGHIHSLDPHSFEFARPQLAAIRCAKMLSPVTRLLGLAADGVERERIGPLPPFAVQAFNRALPLCRAAFGHNAIETILRWDRPLVTRLRGYAGMTFVLLKDAASCSPQPLRQVSPRQVVEFAVPLHYPAR